MVTGSMFFYVICLLYFRLLVGREVDGQHVFSLYLFFYVFDCWSDAKLSGRCGWSWVPLGASAGGIEPLLGPLWAVLGYSWRLCGRSWPLLGPQWAVLAALEASIGGLGVWGSMLAVLGRSWGRCGWSWAALRGHVGGPGPLLWPLLAILDRSWASVGGPESLLDPILAYVGGPGPLLGTMLAVLGPLSAVLGHLGAKSAPNPSGRGPQERSWVALGTYLGLCWRSWAALGAYVGGLGLPKGSCPPKAPKPPVNLLL